MRVSENAWLTHDNGGRPFLVKQAGDHIIRVFQLVEEYGEPRQALDTDEHIEGGVYELVREYHVDWVMPAKDLTGLARECTGDLPVENYEGFVVLAKLFGKHEMVLISSFVATFPFGSDEELERDPRVEGSFELYSTSVSNDVWYPAMRSTHATYALGDHVSDEPIMRLPHEKIEEVIERKFVSNHPTEPLDPFKILFDDESLFDGIGEYVIKTW